MIPVPCHGCTKRWVLDDGTTCHGTCKDYIEYKRLKEEERLALRKEKDIDAAIIKLQQHRVSTRAR